MLVYRDRQETVTASGARDLIEVGQFESGCADTLCPDFDEDLPPLHALRRATIAAAHGRSFELPPGVPGAVRVSIPEGYAYYALYPETYRLAARDFVIDALPARVAVIGIRTIGTSLSAAVAATLEDAGCEVQSWTLRPRGHPFDRRVEVGPLLDRRWRSLANGWCAIVDEGPGLSGSSFASVAAKAAELGFPNERIVFLPSWNADPAAFVSDSARRRWIRHRNYARDFESLVMFPGARDLSGGAWRCGHPYPAVQPQHERRKYLCGGTLHKFAGLGRYGAGKMERAASMAEAGFGPRPIGVHNGFLAMPFVSGRPLHFGQRPVEALARYLAFVGREFRGGEMSDLTGLLRVNTEEAFGRPAHIPQPDGAPVAVDGRMLPHEWLAGAEEGFVKTDALDHHADHFYPGCTDIAWDVAGTCIEFGLGAGLVERYAALSGDSGIGRRLPFYRAAYLAFRLGYCDLAARSLGSTTDGRRFGRMRARYAALLKPEVNGNGR